MEKFLYHMVPNNMKGNKIYPLNVLKSTEPDFYELYVKKYEWREYLLKTEIDIFDCLRNDVIFLSPIHPKEISEEQCKAWFVKKRVKKWFKIPIWKLEKNNIGVWLSENNFTLLTDEVLKRIEHLPEKTKEYYKKCYESWKRPLILANAPHILYNGPIDISDVEIIEV